MATFTIEYRRYLELYGEENLGLDTYPIFDEAHRPILNKKITDRFYLREIGVETPELFANRFRRKMNEVMPYYNQLYKTELLEFDPLTTIKVKNTGIQNSESNSDSATNSTSNSTSDSTSRSVTSTTPQVQLSGNGDYASGLNDVNGKTVSDGTGADSSTGTSSSVADQESEQIGYTGIPSDLLTAFRSTILNIDLMVLDDMDELFMQIWDTSDHYTTGGYFL